MSHSFIKTFCFIWGTGCVCVCVSVFLSLSSLVLLSPTIHYYCNTGLYLIICCYLMLFLFCLLDCKLLESRNSVFILYSSWCHFLRCSVNPCGLDDFEAYDINKSYVCKVAGLRSAVSSRQWSLHLWLRLLGEVKRTNMELSHLVRGLYLRYNLGTTVIEQIL